MNSVNLKDVTADNWKSVIALELDPAQQDLVASNLYSLAESRYDPNARPRAIYAGKRIVGFLMYEVEHPRHGPPEASIYRFMIGRTHQGKGYGRSALIKAIEEIRALPQVKKISISYMPKNLVAKSFYASVGFVEAGLDEDGEMIAVLSLSSDFGGTRIESNLNC